MAARPAACVSARTRARPGARVSSGGYRSMATCKRVVPGRVSRKWICPWADR